MPLIKLDHCSQSPSPTMTTELPRNIEVKLTSEAIAPNMTVSSGLFLTTLISNCKNCQYVATLTFGSGAVAGYRMIGTDLWGGSVSRQKRLCIGRRY